MWLRILHVIITTVHVYHWLTQWMWYSIKPYEPQDPETARGFMNILGTLIIISQLQKHEKLQEPYRSLGSQETMGTQGTYRYRNQVICLNSQSWDLRNPRNQWTTGNYRNPRRNPEYCSNPGTTGTQGTRGT